MAPDAVVFILYYSEICKKSIDNEVALDACTKAFTFEVEFNLEDLQKKKSLLKERSRDIHDSKNCKWDQAARGMQ